MGVYLWLEALFDLATVDHHFLYLLLTGFLLTWLLFLSTIGPAPRFVEATQLGFNALFFVEVHYPSLLHLLSSHLLVLFVLPLTTGDLAKTVASLLGLVFFQRVLQSLLLEQGLLFLFFAKGHMGWNFLFIFG